MPYYSCFIVILFVLAQNGIVLCLRSRGSLFVNRHIQDQPTRLVDADFQRIPPPESVNDAFSHLDSWIPPVATVQNKKKLWPSGVVPHVISSQYSLEARAKIATAFRSFHDNTCVRFVPKATDRDYVYIRPIDGCSSTVGCAGGLQNISLDERCFDHKTIVHHLMHTLGFFRQHDLNDKQPGTPYSPGNTRPYHRLKASSGYNQSEIVLSRGNTMERIGHGGKPIGFDKQGIMMLYCTPVELPPMRPPGPPAPETVPPCVTEPPMELAPPTVPQCPWARPRPTRPRPAIPTPPCGTPAPPPPCFTTTTPPPTTTRPRRMFLTVRHIFSFGGQSRRCPTAKCP